MQCVNGILHHICPFGQLEMAQELSFQMIKTKFFQGFLTLGNKIVRILHHLST